MVYKINQDVQRQSQTNEVYRLNRRVIILTVVAVIMVTMACSLPYLNYEGKFSKERIKKEDEEYIAQILAAEAPEISVSSTEEAPVSIPEPAYQRKESQGSEAVINDGGINEYAVSAQDFTCICSVGGNVSVELRVSGDQLEIIDPGGDAQVFDKIGENTYKRSWMGYYIDTTDGKETKVDEEKSVIIILTDTGHILEHYKGSESSPCCIYTYTQVK